MVADYYSREGLPPGLAKRESLPPGLAKQLRERGRLPGLKNTEMNPTSTVMSVLFWVGLGVLTFVLLVAGYGTGFWG